MREWLPKRREHLDAIIEQEAPPASFKCTRCGDEPKWRCITCLGRPVLCASCCQTEHRRHPFHRIEVWEDGHFKPGWLRQLGLVIHLGHSGDACPNDFRFPAMYPNSNESDPVTEDEEGAIDETEEVEDEKRGEPQRDHDGNPVLVVADKSGIHHLAFRWCRCANAQPDDIQLLDMGFYPSTYKNIKTVFTFNVLDDFLLDNQECKTSAHHYFEKLRRLTSPAFPGRARVRTLFVHYDNSLRSGRIDTGSCYGSAGSGEI